jgi:hypothetical protein
MASAFCDNRCVCQCTWPKAAASGPQRGERESLGSGSKAVVARLIAMSPSKTDYYRGRAEDCCRNAIIAEDIERRLHWLEAASRWVSLARQEGVLPPKVARRADIPWPLRK